MKFEIGKFYKHEVLDQYLSILTPRMDTTQYGTTLIAEVFGSHRREIFMAVGNDEASAENYIEITAEEWMSNFP